MKIVLDVWQRIFHEMYFVKRHTPFKEMTCKAA
jgi:hypothetical protein